jgi:hypothetical protein
MKTRTSEPPKKTFTQLKFIKSEETGAYISFVSQNPKTGRIIGVRQNSKYPKKICIIDQKLAHTIIPGILYSATLIPMHEKNGYIIIEATPISFNATVETSYIPGICYKTEVKFGNKTVVFDPLYGRRDSVTTIMGVREVLEKRMDIRNLLRVVDEFLEHADGLMKCFVNDGAVRQREKTLRND